jgi:suppressor of ftsI
MKKYSFRVRFDVGNVTPRALLAFVLIVIALRAQAQTTPLLVPPEVRSHDHVASLALHAVRGNDGRNSFAFNGRMVAPIIRISPGDTLKITYENDLPQPSGEQCSVGPCMNMTNLHFHGLGISPKPPADDVLGMIAMPGQTLNYVVHIPPNQEPGLYWYHTHPHGESEQQVLDGMSGAIIVEGMERYAPMVRGLPERILILRGPAIKQDANGQAAMKRVEAVTGCGNSEAPERVFTINGDLRPTINIAPGERQFWRIVNASADRYADVQLDGQPWQIVALDGMPLAYHDPKHPVRIADHVLLPPASRLEAVVTGPPAASNATLRTRCVDTGPDGDPTPAMVLADIVPTSFLSPPLHISSLSDSPPASAKEPQLASLESSPPQFVATFTEDKKGFYINGRRYEPDAAPMTEAQVGTYQHWRVVNQTKELHPMHLHQVHFLVYAVNGTKLANPEWVDTANVPYGGSIDMIVDFTNPAIRGMSVFHCHLLNHEDKGMMAKILLK